MIVLEHLTKKYFGNTVVNDLSLIIKKGSVFGFLGQNGSGKTTTIKMIVGLSIPNSGTVTIAGKPSSEIATREKIGFMPEAPYFYERLTGLEFMRFCNELFDKTHKKTDDELLEILKTVGMEGARNRVISTYSKGMKQRLGFAQALVNNPEYIFLDEPLDGLDPIGRKETKEVIKKLKNQGKTIFFNSHILYDTEELCDEVGIIHRGELIYAGGVQEFCKGKSLEDRFVETVEAHINKAQ